MPTDLTINFVPSRSATRASDVGLVVNLRRFIALAEKAGVEDGLLFRLQIGVERPVFLFNERANLAFTFHNHADGYGLDAPGGKTAADFIPEQGRDLVADQPVQHAAGLLGIHQVDIDDGGFSKAFWIEFFVISLNITRKNFGPVSCRRSFSTSALPGDASRWLRLRDPDRLRGRWILPF